MPIFSLSKQQSLSHERLKELVIYRAEDGSFVWNKGRPGAGGGKPCGSLKPSGYVLIRLDGKFFRAHRLAWFYIHGEWPADEIDHINGNRSDNRICNLRVASRSRNSCNKPMRKDNQTGAKSVLYFKDWGAYYVRFNLNKTTYNFGPFTSFDEAKVVAIEKRKEAHGEFFR